MRQQTYLFEVLTMALTMVLIFVVCWQALSLVIPPCDYDCVKTVGPGNCKEKVRGADQMENPNCLGVYLCHPASGKEIKRSHDVFDSCRTSTGKLHLQHVTTINWDTDNDGIQDTQCNALHSCPGRTPLMP